MKIPNPPTDYVPFKWKHKSIGDATVNLCPNCGKNGFCYRASKWQEDVSKLTEYEQKHHWSRYSEGECANCGIKIWHDFLCWKHHSNCSLHESGCDWHYYYLPKDKEPPKTEIKEIINPKLQQETAQRLLGLIRMCHPNEKGEPYGRFEVIEEIQRRGPGLLKEIGWPDGDDSIYKNRYTGTEEKLKDLIISRVYEEDRNLTHELPFLMENWAPIDKWTGEALLRDYKQNPKLTEFF